MKINDYELHGNVYRKWKIKTNPDWATIPVGKKLKWNYIYLDLAKKKNQLEIANGSISADHGSWTMNNKFSHWLHKSFGKLFEVEKLAKMHGEKKRSLLSCCVVFFPGMHLL